MGKVALFVVGAVSMIGMLAAAMSRQNVHEANEQVANHQYEILARNAALAGLNKAEQKLSDSFASTEYGGTFEHASYTTTVTVTAGRAKVLSTGTSTNSAGETIPFNVQAEYEPFSSPSGIAEEAPAFLDHAVLAEKDLLLQGNIDGDVCEICVDGSEAITLNANMHTNSNLHVTGNAASVRGFGTYVGAASSNPPKALKKTFDPYYNPMGSETVHQVDRIEIPSLNVAYMAETMLADSVAEGSFIFSGNNDFGGTRENPYIIHVKGNVTCSGGTTLDGYVMLLVEGSVTFTGNLKVGDSHYDGPDESSLAIYSQGDIEFGGNVEVWGQLFTAGDVWFHGTPDVYGTITSRNRVNFAGNVNIFYRVASPALTTYWNGETVPRLRRLTYAEW